MKKTLEVIKLILKWFNCWQSYLSFFIIGFIIIFLNDDFLFIFKKDDLGKQYFNDIQYVLFGYALAMFLGYIHFSRFDSAIVGETKKYISFKEYAEKIKFSGMRYPFLFVVLPLLGLMLKWMYFSIILVFVALPLKLVGIEIF